MRAGATTKCLQSMWSNYLYDLFFTLMVYNYIVQLPFSHLRRSLLNLFWLMMVTEVIWTLLLKQTRIVPLWRNGICFMQCNNIPICWSTFFSFFHLSYLHSGPPNWFHPLEVILIMKILRTMMCSWKIWRWGIVLLCFIEALFWLFLFGSRAPPERDEANGGNRDPLLKNTYDGLPNLRCICVTLFRCLHICC